MTSVRRTIRRPPRLTWVGSHEAIGAIFEDPLELLRWWTPGAQVFAHDTRFVLRFPSPRRLRSDDVRGRLVLLRGDVLTTVPLDVPPPNAPAGSLVEARAGELVVCALGERIDPSEWLVLDAVRMLEPIVIARVPTVARDALPAVGDAREAIGDAIPPAAEGAREAADSIAHALAKGAVQDDAVKALPPKSTASKPSGSGWLDRARASLGRWLFGSDSESASASRANANAESTRESRATELDTAPRRSSWLRRLVDGLGGWLSARLFRARLAAFVSRRQAEYVARYLELFDRGDVKEALRWAIPLGSESGDGHTPPPSLGTPTARTSLAISGRMTPARTTFGAGLPSLHEILKARYLRVLETLKERGEIDEAAFVLAELLRDAEGAVALLERHGRLLQAARLADARELDPVIRVRLWMLARDVPRALTIARRHAVFPAAITALRSRHVEAADALALEWANQLAEVGDFAGAVGAVRGVAAARPLRRVWLEHAIDAGGVVGAQMLAVRAVEASEHFEDTVRRVREMLGDRSDERGFEVEAFARELAAPRSDLPATNSAIMRALATPTVRELWRRGSTVASVLEAHVDGALRADRPSPTASSNPMPAPFRLAVDPSDVGALPVRDLALLPSGKLVVALGEAGLRVYARDGRHVATIDAPADALVTSDHGAYVIAVARRGELLRLTRVDVDRRIARPWWETKLHSFARTFDGSRWLVCERGVATLIDATDERWSALARLSDLETFSVDRAGERALLIATDDHGRTFERWTYDVALQRLHRREAIELDQIAIIGGRTTEVVLTRSEDACSLTRTRDGWKHELRQPPLLDTLRADDQIVVIASRTDFGVQVELLPKNTPERVGQVDLRDATSCATCLTWPLVAIGDDRGRVLVVDLARASLRLDLRIRA